MTRTLSIAIALFLALSAHAWAAPGAKLAGTSTVDSMRTEAMKMINEGKVLEAAPLLKQILMVDPADVFALRYSALARQITKEPQCRAAAEAFFAGRTQDAVTMWRKIVEMDPGDMRVQLLIEEALANTDIDIRDSLYERAAVSIASREYDDAEQALMKILRAFPTEQRAKEMLDGIRASKGDQALREMMAQAQALNAKGEFDAAVILLKKVLDINPKHEVAARMLSQIERDRIASLYKDASTLAAAGDYASARERWTQILAQNPTDAAALFTSRELGEIIKITPKLNDTGKAADVIKRGIIKYITAEGDRRVSVLAARYASQVAPGNATFAALRDLFERTSAAEAVSMLRPATDVNAIDQYIASSLSNIYENRAAAAADDCNLVLEVDPYNIMALKRLGSAYFLMNQREKARQAWLRAQSVDPNDPELKGFLRQVGR